MPRKSTLLLKYVCIFIYRLFSINIIIQQQIVVHIIDTYNYLQHPDFQTKNDILRTAFDKNLNITSEDDRNKFTGITSFEFWKFLSLYLNGSIVTYDILYLSPVYMNSDCIEVMNLMRAGITNKIGISATN